MSDDSYEMEKGYESERGVREKEKESKRIREEMVGKGRGRAERKIESCARTFILTYVQNV